MLLLKINFCPKLTSLSSKMNLKNFKTMGVIDPEETCDIVKKLQIEFKDHDNLTNRLKKTLYYGKLPKNSRTSLPLTEVAVELFAKAVPKGKLDIVGMDFASSISRQACISPCSLMLALVYLERLRFKNPEYLQTISSCDLFLVSLLVASKYLFDDGEEEEVFNDEWAASAHMETKELNRLERNFLSAMNWHLFVKPQAFYEALKEIENRIAHWESCKRGWLTYTDVYILTQKDWLLAHYWNIIVEDIVKVIVVSVIAYASAVATLVTASTIAHQCTTVMSSPTTIGFPSSCNISANLPTTGETALLQEETTTGQIYFYQKWHSILSAQIFNSPIAEPVNDHLFSLVTINNSTRRTSIYDKENSLFSKDFWLYSEEGFEKIWPVVETKRKFSVWDSFQYWPTCCGGVNSYLV